VELDGADRVPVFAAALEPCAGPLIGSVRHGEDVASARLGDAVNLAQRLAPVGHVFQHVLGDDEIESPVVERRRLYVLTQDAVPGGAGRDVVEELGDDEVLLALADGPRHAYGLAQGESDASSGTVRLELGSLYRVLARLSTAGLIADDVRERAEGGQEGKRRYDRLTPLGRRVAEAETARLQAGVRLARRRRLSAGKSH
jgi:DNA-binding PadR family transcriptional regulator